MRQAVRRVLSSSFNFDAVRSVASDGLGASSSGTSQKLSISLPGAGALVWWQLGERDDVSWQQRISEFVDFSGVLHGLSSSQNLANVPLVGSSSGAMAAALSASGACLERATSRGSDLFRDAEAARRPFGLIGVLGRLATGFLLETLPPDAALRCQGRASFLVTTLPFLRTRVISDFSCRADLIKMILASAHIPLVVDMRMFVFARGSACVDGGLWWLVRGSPHGYRHKTAAHSLILRADEDVKLAGISSLRHSVLSRPTKGFAEAVPEMFGIGVEFAKRFRERNSEAFETIHEPVT